MKKWPVFFTFVICLSLILATAPETWAKSTPALSCGYNHSLALKEDGTVWAWGNNLHGQLGIDSCANRSKPVQVVNLENIKAIAAVFGDSYALSQNGVVYRWGMWAYAKSQSAFANHHQYNDGYDAEHPIKMNISGTVDQIAASSNTFLPYNADSKLFTMPPYNPQKIHFKQIVPGADGFLGLSEDGSVWFQERSVWNENKGYATQIKGLSNIVSITGDCFHLALSSDGTVWTWGLQFMADGTSQRLTTPQKINGLTGIKKISSLGLHNLALKDDGTVFQWGFCGVLNTDDSKSRKNGLEDSPFMLKTTNQSQGWWFPEPDYRKNVIVPTKVPGLTKMIDIAAGTAHCMALKSDGTVWTWGFNDFGQLGDGTTRNSETPVQVKGFNVKQ